MRQAMNFRAAALAALIATMTIGSVRPGIAADATIPTIQVVGSDSGSQFVPLGVGKSVVIDLPSDIKDVLVADPKIANAVVRSSRRAYLIGVAVGQTNVYFFDAEGKQLAGFDIAVTRDLNGIRNAIKQVLPNADIRVQGVADGVMVAGFASSPAEAQQAYDIAARLVGDGAKVVNGIIVRGRDQVMLKVTVAEVQRDVIKQLGIDLSGDFTRNNSVINLANANPFPIQGGALVSSNALTGSFRGVSVTLRAMERAGLIRTLAEPNLTAISGESANFLAGGEFPIPAGFTCDPTTRNCQTQIQFKKFGVGLNFTPVVLSEGRISLKVLTEVSELSNENALTIVQSVSSTETTTLTIPSIKTRRAETTVEIPSGGSLAMAGMIQEQTKQQLNGMPGLMNLPVLGALFKSRDFQNHATELMVLVTPYVVRAVSQKELSRPDDGFADASDQATTLLGNFNRLYGTRGNVGPRQTYRGNYGFILD
ncbi:MAG TPA: type II and III secretion system protein family protein [Xanthobacteraceae bacterium]|nr:type II and III secretion system protein family protein [Xanthobacteraceae bacterium]